MTRSGPWNAKAIELTEYTDKHGAPYYEKVQELIKRHMEKKKLDAIRKLNAQMDKKWKSLAERLPYGVEWMNKSAELLNWYYQKRKKIREKAAPAKVTDYQ